MSANQPLRCLFPLTSEIFASTLEELKKRIEDRVVYAFIFGSAGTEQMSLTSDIDLILVVDGPLDSFFPHRPLAFRDLYELFPRLDILVYSRSEWQSLSKEPREGFWSSVFETIRQIA